MKKRWGLFLLLVLVIGLFAHSAALAFTSGSTGADGPFNPTTNTEVVLPPDGILNYTTVNIPTGVTVTFKKNANNTPVYMLATGDITISGTISVNGGNGSTIYPGIGGPGGYDGGYGGTLATYGSNGMGPNGGAGGVGWYGWAYGNVGGSGSITTNDRVIPSVGGSGGGGGGGANAGYSGFGGGGGGGAGALLIASSTKVTINGTITANGGNGGAASGTGGGGGGGSAGTIKVVTNELAGNGTVQATGVTNGKIRFEFNTISRTASTTPMYTFDYPGQVFYFAAPYLKITSVGGLNVPQNPSADYMNTDITLPANIINPVAVTVSASNIPAGSTVTVKAIPQYETIAAATATAILSGTDQSSSATASITLSTKRPSILIATTTFNVTVASSGTPLYADGEKVAKVKVDTQLSGGSTVTYITESGREVLAMNARRF
ncbi:MAG: hypothetical protein HZB33_14660 [Nitrospirae bacterium]|nr:hypothetical protein [Nitrospirota bacterium]